MGDGLWLRAVAGNLKELQALPKAFFNPWLQSINDFLRALRSVRIFVPAGVR